MTLSDILKDRRVILAILVIWGFGLAILFRRVCRNNTCTIYKSPAELKRNGNRIYSNGKCYHLTAYPSPCVY